MYHVLESATSGSDENADGVTARIAHRQVERRVSIQIADDNTRGLHPCSDGGRRTEAGLLVQEDNHSVAVEVGRHEIAASIGIEVAGGNPSRLHTAHCQRL